jgi:hypothetical protein
LGYTPQTWTDGSGGGTPLSAARMAHIESGLDAAADVADNAFALASSGGGGGGGTAAPFAVQVASNDATTAQKAAADYVCDGTADEVQINSALTDAAALNSRGGPVGAEQRGTVELSGGEFNIANSILMWSGTRLKGQGILTRLLANSLTASTGSGTDPAVIKKATADEHLIKVDNMWLAGNFASGGGCHAIYFEGNGSASRSGYPDSNPDTDHWFDSLFINGFTTGTRHGIYLSTSTGTAVERGSIISNVQMRNCSGDGISIVAASDVRVLGGHIGGSGRYGIRASGGNTEVSGLKCFFCNDTGFYASSGRCIFTHCISQDCSRGFFFDGAPTVASSLMVDTSDVAGIQISSNKVIVDGFQVFVRAGGRYGTQAKGLYYDATYADLTVIGQVDPANITAPTSGAAGARSFVRVSDGSTLISVG